MAAGDGDDSLYPIAVLIDELRNEDVQVQTVFWGFTDLSILSLRIFGLAFSSAMTKIFGVR